MPTLLNDETDQYKSIVRKQEFDKEINDKYQTSVNEHNQLVAKNKETFVTKLYTELANEFLKDVICIQTFR